MSASETATQKHASDEKAKDSRKDADKNTEVRFESSMPLEEAVSYFEAIVSGLKKGTLSLTQDGNCLTLTPPLHLDVEVKAVRKKGKERLQFELGWRTSPPSDLQISSE